MTNNDDEWRRDSDRADTEAAWQEMLDAVPAAVYTCDAKGLITYFNRSAEALWGRAPKLRDAGERYCGSNQLYLSDGTPIRREECLAATALAEGKATTAREIVVRRGDGSRIVGEAYAYPLRDDRGQIIGVLNLVAEVATVRDQGTAPDLEAARKQGADAPEPYRTPIPRDATLAIIEIAVSLLTSVKWKTSAFN